MRFDTRHYTLFALLTGAVLGGGMFLAHRGVAKALPQASVSELSAPADTANGVSANEPLVGEVLGVSDQASLEELGWPLTNAPGRVTKKPFGIFITPETSPVPNDHFNGIHVGVDFETTPEEADTDVPVFAICGGPLRMRTWANGYGGVATQSCVIDGEDVTVIYGHLNVATILPKIGAQVAKGDQIALLGKGGSEETDGVRKHLHLGIRRVDAPSAAPEEVAPEPPKTPKADIRGYVKDSVEEEKFMDALKVIQK